MYIGGWLMYIVEIMRSDKYKRQWWWHIKSGNGRVLAHSEMYTTRPSAYRVAKKIAIALKAELVDKK